MKEIKKTSTSYLTMLLDLGQAVDELRLEVPGSPTLVIRWGQEIRTREGMGQLVRLGTLVSGSNSECVPAFDLIVYDTRKKKKTHVHGRLKAYPIAGSDARKQLVAACALEGSRIVKTDEWLQAKICNQFDKWLADLKRKDYGQFSVPPDSDCAPLTVE